MTRSHTRALVALMSLAVFSPACSSKDKNNDKAKPKPKPAKKKPSAVNEAKPKSKPEPTPVPVGKVVLEQVTVPHVGKMLLPKGVKQSAMSKAGGHYRLPLSANGFDNLYIDYETVGKAATLKQARSLAGVIAHTAKETAAKTLPSGVHVVERKRAKDDKIWVIAFRNPGYVSCWGPADKLDDCRKIAASVPKPTK